LQELAVKKAEQQVELARQKLNLAMLERKTHEKLKENAKEVFFMELASGERKEVDELVSFKYNNPTN
jgi:flagellar FliJ protein